jgi:hypothetical protein
MEEAKERARHRLVMKELLSLEGASYAGDIYLDLENIHSL